MLQLNKLPRWSLLWLFFPLFNYSVDKVGMAGVMAPNVLMTLNMLNHVPNVFPTRKIVCSLLGGMVGGKVMQLYFPDDDFTPKRSTIN